MPKFQLNPNTIYKSSIFLSIILGISHGIADAAAGFLLGKLANTMSLEQASGLMILYNILGFGYQPLAGMLTDQFKRPRLAVCLGLLSLILALGVAHWYVQLAVILAGIGSAAFHVGGGALTLLATSNCTTDIGIFAAPGVLGLAIGGVLGLTGYSLSLPLVLLLVIMIPIIAQINLAKLQNKNPKSLSVAAPSAIQNPKSNDWVMLLLLLAIALTSTVWVSFQFLLQDYLNMIISLAFAAAIAKVFGGFLAHKWGWRRWTVGSLIIATVFLLFGGLNSLTLILSLSLLQSTIPVTLAAMAQIMPQQPATATGFALGFAIIMGGIPVIIGFSHITGTPIISSLNIILITISLGWILKSKTVRMT